MVSKSQIKLIRSLAQKKYRLKHGLFVVEGKKTVTELLASDLKLYKLFTVEDSFLAPAENTMLLDAGELKKISFLKNPQTVLAVFEIPELDEIKNEGLILALDGVRDPGNLGTIIRLCDWFGIKDLVCSEDTVDCYNPKVVQATMGSLSRVNISYRNLTGFLEENRQENKPVFGAFMDGENVYKSTMPARAVLVMGNEANGISADIERLISKKIAIPQFGETKETESLNVSTATAILLSEFRRNAFIEK